MKRYELALLLTLVFTGCFSNRVFMGDYDLAKITISHEQVEIVVENYPYEASMASGILQKEIADNFEFKLLNEPNSTLTEGAKDKREININIVCSDKRTRDELLESFSSNRIVIEKRFHKPADSTVITKVAIHPGSKLHGLDGKYHLVTFETKGELVGGDHRVLVKDPLAFSFAHLESVSNKNQVTMLIKRYIDNKYGNIALRDRTSILPFSITFQVLSQSISTMKKPIKIIFTNKG
mgnify:CR=1 FL=1|jgi:hypothetical protein